MLQLMQGVLTYTMYPINTTIILKKDKKNYWIHHTHAVYLHSTYVANGTNASYLTAEYFKNSKY